MQRLKAMCVMGTRPEAIKVVPIVLAARDYAPAIEMVSVSTAQHRQMLDDVLATFGVCPAEDLDVMAPGQSLHHVAARVIAGMGEILDRQQPDVVIVQGDTTTTVSAAMAAYYAGVAVAHVEAGLRTGDKHAPFPEEGNRCMTSCLADLHFAPTEAARDNLLAEGVPESQVFVTGNTVIDAVQGMARKVSDRPCPVRELRGALADDQELVLVTGHRRESFGSGLRRICDALLGLASARPEIAVVYPVHPNPRVMTAVRELRDRPNIHLVPPQSYPDFVWLMQRSKLIITDSGGIQEEAPALGKPVLVTRTVTERPEAVEAGAARLVGYDPRTIVAEAEQLLCDDEHYRR
ncbi:MAG: UDP-N-acetylglucosamine 2-epimerase (non-hydrolyzing), partial [Thermoanaerobaculia bacterium]|nr:UDP-N-acetylglucosamine 2-epimerase (non-hydrolyzing) [Thermoanaerobaculia bacterium]